MGRLVEELAEDLAAIASQVRQIKDALSRSMDMLENDRIRRRDLVYLATQTVRAMEASERADERLERFLLAMENLKRLVWDASHVG